MIHLVPLEHYEMLHQIMTSLVLLNLQYTVVEENMMLLSVPKDGKVQKKKKKHFDFKWWKEREKMKKKRSQRINPSPKYKSENS